MKRIIIIAIALVFTCALLAGCGSGEQAGQGGKTMNITVQGAVFGGAGDDRIKTSVSFDPQWIIKGDNTKYNKDLAAFAAIISDDVYFRTKDLEKGTPNRVLFEGENEEEYDRTGLIKEFGFTEAEYIESFKAREYKWDGNDSVTMLLAHCVVDGKYDLYAIAFRGSFSVQEWISVFDPGSDCDNYTGLTGEHPEWTDKKACKGLDIAKNRAMEFIDEFMEENDNPDFPDFMLVTGHSRGAGLAGMIGAVMEDREDVRSFTYTFNTPGVTTDENAVNYKTIFNIFDTNDFYTDPMPFGEEKLYHYGRDMSMEIAGADEVEKEISELKGRDDYACMSAEEKAAYAELFGKRFPDRKSLYDMVTVTQKFDTEEEALARTETCNTLIGSENGLGLDGLCFVETEGKEVSMTYCSGAILIAYAKSLAYGEDVFKASAELFEEDKDACEVLDFLRANIKGISGGHLLINGFVMSRAVSE